MLVGRQFQRRPGLVRDWADELGVEVKVANQIEWALSSKGTTEKAHNFQKSSKL